MSILTSKGKDGEEDKEKVSWTYDGSEDERDAVDRRIIPVRNIPAAGGPPMMETPYESSTSDLCEDDGVHSESSNEWHLPGIVELNRLEDQRAVERTKSTYLVGKVQLPERSALVDEYVILQKEKKDVKNVKGRNFQLLRLMGV